MLKVTGLPSRDVLRVVALDSYDGTTWTTGNRTVVDDNASLFQRIATEVGARRPGRHVQVGVEVKPAWRSSWLPLAGQLTHLSFDYLDGRAQRKDVRYNVATQTGMVVGGLQTRDDYTFSATIPDSRLRRSMTAYGTGAPTQPAGSSLDRYLGPWKESGLTADPADLLARRLPRGQRALQRRWHGCGRPFPPGPLGAAAGLGVHRRAIDRRGRRAVRRVHGARGQPARRTCSGGGRCQAGQPRLGARSQCAGLGGDPGDRRELAHAGARALHVAQAAQEDRSGPDAPELRTPGRRAPPTQSLPSQGQQPRQQQQGEGGSGAAWLLRLVPSLVVLIGLVPGLKWLRRRRRRGAPGPRAGSSVVGPRSWTWPETWAGTSRPEHRARSRQGSWASQSTWRARRTC